MRERVLIVLVSGAVCFSFAAACGGSSQTAVNDGSGGVGATGTGGSGLGGGLVPGAGGSGLTPGAGGAGVGGAGVGGAGGGAAAGGSGGVPVTCGNGGVDPGELCDGADLNGETCASATMNAAPTGTLSCTSTCNFDVGGCVGAGTGGGSGAGGAGGGGGMGTGGGGGVSCNPAFCPNPGFGSPCCITTSGPCGIDVGMGCMPRMTGDGGP